MQTFRDYMGREIRLTEERITHILVRHPEILAFTHTIAETLEAPDSVEPDEDDPEVWKYNRWYTETNYGDKWMVVVVVRKPDDAFISTAYITNEI